MTYPQNGQELTRVGMRKIKLVFPWIFSFRSYILVGKVIEEKNAEILPNHYKDGGENYEYGEQQD